MLSGWGSSNCHAPRKCCACASVPLLAGIIIWSVKRTQLVGTAAYPQTVWNNIDVVGLQSDRTGCHGRRRTLPLSLGLWIWFQSKIHFHVFTTDRPTTNETNSLLTHTPAHQFSPLCLHQSIFSWMVKKCRALANYISSLLCPHASGIGRVQFTFSWSLISWAI
jgi:hypothetical protein